MKDEEGASAVWPTASPGITRWKSPRLPARPAVSGLRIKGQMNLRANVVSARPTRFWLALIVLSAPLACLAQAVPTYVHVPGWPSYNNGSERLRRNEVTGVATDAEGRVYTCNATRTPVMVFDRAGNYLGSWGWPHTTEPHAIRIDPEGNFWVPDLDTHQVCKFTPTGTLLFALGERRKRGSDTGHFNRPTDVAFGLNDDAFIADGYGNSRVVKVRRSTGQFLATWGRRGSGPGQFHTPHSIATDAAGLVYVADRENRRVQVFSPDGAYLREWGTGEKPFGLFVTPEQRMYICYEYPCTIGVYDLFGSRLAYWGGKPIGKAARGRTPGLLCDPHMLALDNQGSLFTAELRGHWVQKWVPR